LPLIIVVNPSFFLLVVQYQLLYVYINDYQSGGFMWYAVFNRSMLALICGILTLLGYLGIRETFFSGPFYLLAPLPFAIGYFWYKCEVRFCPSTSLNTATRTTH
jgi:fucose 4-O-acetylase-like acetyltransferase